MTCTFAPASEPAVPLYLVASDRVGAALEALPDAARDWAGNAGFTGAAGQVVALPGADGGVAGALVGFGGAQDLARQRFVLGGARSTLPVGTYTLDTTHADADPSVEALGWLLAGYGFRRYRASDAAELAQMVAPDGVDAAELETLAASECLTRDLVNTPAADMGPPDLAAAAEELAQAFGVSCTVIEGDDLLAQNFPMIHAVGRAAAHAPRLIEFRWGSAGPQLTLVGKGVCFDTGGLNLKPGNSMALMKKDMGGAANVLGLARTIMAMNLPVRLRVLVPAVENSVSGSSFRPGDILTARNGMTVEVNNTDAEGRLVLADALALAVEEPTDLIVSMATLTGAARVALGPDLAPFYATEDGDADALHAAARKVADPVWRMPFWDPYEPMIEPGIADLDNAPAGGFAGSITAALFLRRFVGDARYMHFDIYSWQPKPAPARPKGGVGQGPRALYAALPRLLGL
ncbi:leucyl aminopeptidase family protein [Pseudaestuariivita atlantica]|uniref:Cytochrome C oxidase subunit II n=1 Tax=Pseudaestuariivita atlantica TaxID=1317121 RepID=A0A0L1JPI0_9RHOB|nr:leucyl aminopeptidase family protein [Pseudaestuariivita atlantica]KNG93313.1 cytochrome C oxidase subunit II [Pseudaestuariivita atlantica]